MHLKRPLQFAFVLALVVQLAPLAAARADDQPLAAPALTTLRIHDIQGAAHTSLVVNTQVTDVPGTVTARRSNGFYMQDPTPDTDQATSEGIFVFTSSAPTVSVGDALLVSGRVQEFRPASTSLTTTEISSPHITTVSTGNTLPPPTIIGVGGRIPPQLVIEDDATGS